MVMSVVAVRKKVCTGDCQRTASSKEVRANSGRCRSRCHSSGWVAKAYRQAARPCTVVSTPAVSRERTTNGACAYVRSPRSAASQIRAPKPSSLNVSRAHWAFTHADSSATRCVSAATRSLRGPKALKAMLP